MIQIIKLARESASDCPEMCAEHTSACLQWAYEAGFRKAQEMAAKIVLREINDMTPTAAIIFIKQMADALVA
jgi:hypothetical protein